MDHFIKSALEPVSEYPVGVVIFTRDLRVPDNLVLHAADACCDKIIPVFQFRQKQIEPSTNKYFSHPAVKFMCESLDDLFFACDKKLSYYYDDLPPVDTYDAIFIAADYTDYAINVREKALIAFAKKNKKQLVIVHNHLLDVPLSVLPGGKDTAYTKFTPYFNAFSHHYKPTIVNSHKAVSKFIKGQKTKGSISPKDIHQYYDPDTVTDIVGGRDEALLILKSLNDYRNYKKERDYPSITNGTTRLSAYNKFGCVSPREVFIAIVKKLGAKHDLLKQMIWREFYYNIAVSYPHTTQGASLREEYDNIKWSYDKSLIRAWKQGTTGYPIVDAGMRQLNQTGYMHNRLRMITASFLIKHLQIDWRVGEKYFAQKLTDYDPIINNGNWQWVAGCGADAQPYFRIFNPELQEKKFDRNREFINTYVTDELEPIVEYKDATARTVKMYKKGLYGGAARPHNPPAGL